MQTRTFKTKVKTNYFRNRKEVASVAMPLKDDVNNFIGTLCIAKTTENDISSIINLDNLCYVRQVHVDKEGHITGFLINPVFGEDYNLDIVVSFRQVKLLTGDVLAEEWFLDGIEKRFGVRPNRKRIMQMLNTTLHLPMKLTVVQRFSMVLLLEVYEGYVDSLEAKEVEIKTNRNKLIVTNNAPYTREDTNTHEFRLTNLTPTKRGIEDYTYKDIGFPY